MNRKPPQGFGQNRQGPPASSSGMGGPPTRGSFPMQQAQQQASMQPSSSSLAAPRAGFQQSQGFETPGQRPAQPESNTSAPMQFPPRGQQNLAQPGRGFAGASSAPQSMSQPGTASMNYSSAMGPPPQAANAPGPPSMSSNGPPPTANYVNSNSATTSTALQTGGGGAPPSSSQSMSFSYHTGGPPRPQRYQAPPQSSGVPSSAGFQGPPPMSSGLQGPPPMSGGLQGPPPMSGSFQGPPTMSGASQGPPPIPGVSQGHSTVSGSAQGHPHMTGVSQGPPPMSGGIDNSQRLGYGQYSHPEAQMGPGAGPPPMANQPPPMYPGMNQAPAGYSTAMSTGQYASPQMFSTGANVNSGAPPQQFMNPSASSGLSPGSFGAPPMRGTPGAPVAAKMATVDTSKNCDRAFMAPTINALPCSDKLVQKTGMPLGLCVHPLAEGPDTPEIPVVDFGNTGPVRCKKCRAYINPFATFIDNGQRWTCNFCSYPNDVPPSYYAKMEGNERVDIEERPELRDGSVELIASSDYMLRAPPPMVYLFLFDVSYNSVSSGMLETAVAAVKESLDHLAGDDRTQVGFITYDTAVHFYRLRQDNPQPQMYVVPDISDVSLPTLHEDLLVNLKETREAVDELLESLLRMHSANRSADSCLGPAIKAGNQMINHIGGKIVICQSTLPTTGVGKLRQRESPKILGTDEEHKLLSADASEDGQFYKGMALECSKAHISVDMFLASNVPYIDVASIGTLARYTAGEVYFYSNFRSTSEGARLHADIFHDLTRTTGLEAVLRIRCSAGVSISSYFGNFFIRGQDLLIMPNVTSDTAFTVQLSVADTLASGSTVSFQTALLYTTPSGSRRILLHTLAIPTATLVSELFTHADTESLQNVIAKVALDNMLRSGLPAARRYLHRAVVEIVRSYNTSIAQGMGSKSQQSEAVLNLPENLQLLPLYAMGLSKSVLFRGGQEIHSDERAFLVFQMLTMQAVASRLYAYPKLLSLHDMERGMGTPVTEEDESPIDSEGNAVETVGFSQIKIPQATSLSVEHLREDGVFLLADGFEMFLWVGRSAPPQLLESLFGVPSLEGVDVSSAQLPQLNNEYSVRVNAIVSGLQEESNPQMRFRIVKQGTSDANEARFHWRLVEDRQQYQGGTFTYSDYLQLVSRETSVGTGLSR
eukprot:gb/GECG01013997.1/.p1 GENE.gb/GECG01013997.1/~~gb/GECG01013997.1/.p1  ORF type:complete len:1159 (+),score=101.80 gb/GECG01013997.1/:1-3477(+)